MVHQKSDFDCVGEIKIAGVDENILPNAMGECITVGVNLITFKLVFKWTVGRLYFET